jgi:hypothetical protein
MKMKTMKMICVLSMVAGTAFAQVPPDDEPTMKRGSL